MILETLLERPREERGVVGIGGSIYAGGAAVIGFEMRGIGGDGDGDDIKGDAMMGVGTSSHRLAEDTI